jgi:hypothetical protein
MDRSFAYGSWSGETVKLRRILLLVAVLLLAASCDMQKVMEAMTPERDLALAQRCFTLLQNRDFAALEAEFNPALRGWALRSRLEQAADQVPSSAPLKSEIVSVNTSIVNGHTTVLMTFQYQFPEGWRQYDYKAEGDDGSRAVESLSVREVAPPDPDMAWLLEILPTALLVIWIGGMVVAMVVIYRLFIRKRR